MKIYQIVGWNTPSFEGPVFGVEVELEGKNIPDKSRMMRALPYWKVETDGSLRGESCEFIMREPFTSDDTKQAIIRLRELLEKKETVCQFSNRTSVHVHLNVADLDIQTLSNIIYIYYLFEDVLLRYCGIDRYDNRFCLSVRRADGLIQELRKKMNQHGLIGFRQDTYKYAALNLAPVITQGSIEFRGMRGTLDSEVLNPWIDVIENIYEAAFRFKNPQEIFNKVNGIGIQFLADQVFKEHLDLFKFQGFEEEVMYNFSICAEMPEILTFKQEAAGNRATFYQHMAKVARAPLPPQLRGAAGINQRGIRDEIQERERNAIREGREARDLQMEINPIQWEDRPPAIVHPVPLV